MKEKTLCFSGHRPEKLPGGGVYSDSRTDFIKSMLYYKIYESIEDGYTCFISGLARGIDLWAAQIVLEFRAANGDLKLICVKPFDSHGCNFLGEDKFVLGTVLEQADEVVSTAREFSKGCYSVRNRYMIDRSSRLIAVVSDYKSGTGQTVAYAKKCGTDIVLLDLSNIEEIMYSS